MEVNIHQREVKMYKLKYKEKFDVISTFRIIYYL